MNPGKVVALGLLALMCLSIGGVYAAYILKNDGTFSIDHTSLLIDGATVDNYITSVAPSGTGANITETTYIAYNVGANYYAQNGYTGIIDYTGTNCSTVLNSAITAVNAGGRGTVKLKNGTYHLTGSIYMKPSVNLVCDTNDAYIELDFDGAAITMNPAVTNSFMGIRGLRIDGNKAARTTGIGVQCYGLYMSTLEQLYLHDFDTYALYMTDSGTTHCKDNVISDIYALNFAGSGIYATKLQDTRIDNINSGTQVDADYCFYIGDGGAGVIMNNIHLWGTDAGTTTGLFTHANVYRLTVGNLYGGGANMDYLIHADGYAATYTGVVGEDTTTACVKLDGTKNTVTGFQIYSANGDALEVLGANCVASSGSIHDPVALGVDWDGAYGTATGINVYDAGTDAFDVAGNYFTGSSLNSWGADSNAFYIVGTNGAYSACAGYASQSSGWALDGSDYCTLSSCISFDSVAGHGFSLNGATWNTFASCAAHSNGAANMRGFNLAGNSSNNTLTSCTAATNGDYNLAIAAGSNSCIYDGCRFDDTGMTANVSDAGTSTVAGDNLLS